jgi:hypothetical protein
MRVAFPLHCQAWNIPQPVAEFRFAAPRRFKFDWAWPDRLIAVEIEGIVYPTVRGEHRLGGRHVSVAGFTRDIEKYALAFTLGWTVLRVLPKHIQAGMAAKWVSERMALTRLCVPPEFYQ